MAARTLYPLFIVGLLDLAYRLFLRDLVRAQIGMETHGGRPSAGAGG